jgi:truncated hemoglobin YjbI
MSEVEGASSWVDRIGGPHVVRAVVERFVARCFADPIIGFLFVGRDAARIVDHETTHALVTLGGTAVYEGRPIVPLHRAMRLHRGHFRRRLALLRQEIVREGLPDPVVEAWVAPQRAMEAAITDGTDCAG